MREHAAMGHIVVAYEQGSKNVADMLTKTQSGPVRMNIVQKVLY